MSIRDVGAAPLGRRTAICISPASVALFSVALAQQWACGSRSDEPPNVVGDAWFEGLRPHLPAVGDAAKYRTAHEVHCDNPTLTLLSLEIGRIETEWTEEAKGRRQRRRDRHD